MLTTPLSAMMANRFTTARAPILEGGEGPIKAGLFVMDDAARAALAESRRLAEEERLAQVSRDRVPENETPLQQAARMGMYGALTREVKVFYPVKLLAKRVGVKAPHPNGPESKDDAGAAAAPPGAAGQPLVDPNAWQAKFKHVGPALTPGQPVPDESKPAEEEPPRLKPAMSIFKAIFASDDEDSDDEDGDGSGAPAPTTAPASAPPASLDTPPPDATDATLITPAADDVDMIGPPPPPPPSALSASLDPATFRPTFKAAPAAAAASSAVDGKPKKDKAKKAKKRAAALSFADEEGEGEEETAFDKERKEAERRERREREKKRREEEDRAQVWVEPPAGASAPPGGGRKRASDFL